MEPTYLYWDLIRYQVLTVVFSIFGRLAAMAVWPNKTKTFKSQMLALYVALFCGTIASLLVAPTALYEEYKFAFVGVVTFFGIDGLFAGVSYLLRRLGMDVGKTVGDVNTLYHVLNSRGTEQSLQASELICTMCNAGRISESECAALVKGDGELLTRLLMERRITGVEYAAIVTSGVFAPGDLHG